MSALDSVGWYEFYHPLSNTTHIAYVYEDGSVYLPEGRDVVDLDDWTLAKAENRVYRLIRERLSEEWCMEESCRYRHWRSGSMPTHKRGSDCSDTEGDTNT